MDVFLYLTVVSEAMCPHGVKIWVGGSLSTQNADSKPIFNDVMLPIRLQT